MSKKIKLSIKKMQDKIELLQDLIKRNSKCLGAQSDGLWKEQIRHYKYQIIGILRRQKPD